jgi:16S rRNA (guanine527-N7)-methyltransferase
MTEDEAKAWLRDTLNVPRGTMARLEAFRQALITESAQQNLISAATHDHIWARHIVDSAQLLRLIPAPISNQSWLDLGTGAGFPGLVIAILGFAHVTLVESRRKRAEFLSAMVDSLGLADRVTLCASRLESLPTTPYSVISARAFAPLPRLFEFAHRFSTEETHWLLPKGRSAREELESVSGTWQGLFHVELSVTDVESSIIVGRQLLRRDHA